MKMATIRKFIDRLKRRPRPQVAVAPGVVTERKESIPETIYHNPDLGDNLSQNSDDSANISSQIGAIQRVDVSVSQRENILKDEALTKTNFDGNMSLRPAASILKLLERDWKLSDFKNIHRIGKGQMGDVCSAFSIPVNKPCVLKFVSNKKLEQHKITEEDIFLESWIQGTANHDHILRAWGEFVHNIDIIFIMEYCPLGSLHNFLQKAFWTDDPKERAKNAQLFTRQIVSGVFYLQSRVGYIHMDLKPQNILMADSNWIKLTDFGAAVRMVSYRHIHGFEDLKGWTTAYCPPEVLKMEGVVFNSTVDVWSIGCIAYEMLTKTNPFFINDFRTKKDLHEAGRPHMNMKRALLGKYSKRFFKKLGSNEHTEDFFRKIFVPFDRRPLVGQLEKLKWMEFRVDPQLSR